jgi:hypothetical protein
MKNTEDFWEKHPTYSIVYAIVKREKTITFNDLIDRVHEESPEVDAERIRSSLIKLEIWGKIDVVSDGKETRIMYRG